MAKKEYKPFYVDFSNGSKAIYDCKSHLAEELGVTRGSIQNWLDRGGHGYVNYGIDTIGYLKNAIYYD